MSEGPLTLAEHVAARLRAHLTRRRFMTEQYDAEGEIEEVWEGRLLAAGYRGPQFVWVSHSGGPAPRTDWRERGVVPPGGYHRRTTGA